MVCAHLLKSYYLTKLENDDYLQISEESCFGPHLSRNKRGFEFVKGSSGIAKVYQPFNGPTIRKFKHIIGTNSFRKTQISFIFISCVKNLYFLLKPLCQLL